MMKFTRPTELADHLCFLSAVDADYRDEFGCTAPIAYAEAFDAIERFIEYTPSEEGKERLRQCIRNLHAAYEYIESGDDTSGHDLVMETEEMFKLCRKYIAISDE